MISNLEPRLIYGLHDGDPVRISDVASGLACNCICPECKTPLIARKGPIRQHHFAHRVETDCAGGVESSLHFLAKKVLSTHQSIVLPQQEIIFPKERERGRFPQHAFRVTSAQVETKFGEIVPDVLIDIYGITLAVEILVTHKVDERKAEQFRKMGLPAIEIDLSRVDRELPESDIARLVVGGGSHKYWVNFDFKEAKKLLFPKPLPIVRNKHVGLRVAGCPKPYREWEGKKYSAPKDCTGCKFFLMQSTSAPQVFCSGVKIKKP